MKCTKCQAQWELPENKVSQLTTCPFCGASVELPQQEKLDSFKAVIASIASRFGVDLLLDRNKAMAYFVDLAPALKKERQMFQYLLQCDGNIQIIQSLSSSADEQIACRYQISARMIEDFFIGKEIADQICDDFWEAVGGNIYSDEYISKEFTRARQLCNSRSENDQREAFDILGVLAERGHIPSQRELSFCYLYGVGCEPNPARSDEWLMKAIESGDGEAMALKAYRLERNYKYPSHEISLLESAFRMLINASKAGYSPAQYKLANIYALGRVEIDPTWAVDYSVVTTVPDWDKAFYWYSQAAKAGKNSALFELGKCYECGKGTAVNFEKAFECYLRSAGIPEDRDDRKCDPNSVCKVALCYECGIGTIANHEYEMLWNAKAVYFALGWAEAEVLASAPFLAYYLGHCYCTGKGVEEDLDQAEQYMQTASNYGIAEATKWLEDRRSKDTKPKWAFWKKSKS